MSKAEFEFREVLSVPAPSGANAARSSFGGRANPALQASGRPERQLQQHRIRTIHHIFLISRFRSITLRLRASSKPSRDGSKNVIDE